MPEPKNPPGWLIYNRQHREERRAKYPYEVVVAKSGLYDPRPEGLHPEHPGSKGCRVPLWAEAVWMFRSPRDLDRFKVSVGLGPHVGGGPDAPA